MTTAKEVKIMDCDRCGATVECRPYTPASHLADRSKDWICTLCANTLPTEESRNINFVSNQVLQAIKDLDQKLNDVLQSIHHVMGGGDTNGD